MDRQVRPVRLAEQSELRTVVAVGTDARGADPNHPRSVFVDRVDVVLAQARHFRKGSEGLPVEAGHSAIPGRLGLITLDGREPDASLPVLQDAPDRVAAQAIVLREPS